MREVEGLWGEEVGSRVRLATSTSRTIFEAVSREIRIPASKNA